MDRTPLVKLLLISALSAGLVVPLFFYSRGLLRQAEQAVTAAQAPMASEPDSPVAEAPNKQDNDASGHAHADSDPAQAPSDPAQAKAPDAGHAGPEPAAQAAPAMALAQAGTLSSDQAGQTKADKPMDPSDPDAGAQAYKPPLFGSCKRMFQQLQKQVVAEGEYKAFAFAFDGKTANCAEYVSNKSLRHARAVVVKNCQEDRAVAKRYVACLLYEVQ
jgi:hypothetical protein